MTTPTVDLAPLVVVGGFLTRNSTSYWGDIEKHFLEQGQNRKIIIAPLVNFGQCAVVSDG